MPETGAGWPARPALSPLQALLVLQALQVLQLAFALPEAEELLWTRNSRGLQGEATTSLSRTWVAKLPVFGTLSVVMAAVTTTSEGKTKVAHRWLLELMHLRPIEMCLKLVVRLHRSFHCGQATEWMPQGVDVAATGPDCGLQSAVRSTQRHPMSVVAKAAACSAMLALKAIA